MSAQLERWHFNVDQYYRLAEVGVLQPDDRVELIEGEIIRMPPIGSAHAGHVNRLELLLKKCLGEGAIVAVQNPVRLYDFSEPVPDIAVLKPRDDFYTTSHPTAEDVLVIVEVSDATILTDRNVKVPLYARADVPEVWLVNLPNRIIEVYGTPAAGAYTDSTTFGLGEQLHSLTVPNLSLRVEEIIG
ncbi:MAG TPA: Uma2 family endonuclease [Pyrinomonadaceae bacterium]|nr:Uma2 family endonuclease [Pyrinomonadaceae bacterium]